MDRQTLTGTFGTVTSTAIGKLIVKLRSDGLFTSDDVQAILRTALANAAPAINAGVPRNVPHGGDAYRSYAAAE